MRPDSEGWGAETLRVELEDDPDLQDEKLPSVRSINTYLKSRGRTRSYGKPSTLMQVEPAPGKGPHTVWQLDAEGNKELDPLGTVSFINIKDTYSKSYVISAPVFLPTPQSHPKRSNYQQAIRLGWMRFGLNKTFQFDHESIFFDNTHPNPYPTPLCLWLVGFGIEISYTPKGKPHKQGAVERSHQTLDRQICHGKAFETEDDLWLMAIQRCNRLNERIPCRTLNRKPPLLVCPHASHSGNPYDLDLEESLFEIDRIYDYLAACKPWFRTVTDNRVVSLGTQQYFLQKSKPGEELQITFNIETKQFEFVNQQRNKIATLSPKAITFDDLKGDHKTLKEWLVLRPDLLSKNNKPDTTFLHNT